MDYFYFFLYRAVELLRPNGSVGCITTAYWRTADGARKLRKYLSTSVSIREWTELGEQRVFESATGQHNLIQVFTKSTARHSIAFSSYIGKHDEKFSLNGGSNWDRKTIQLERADLGEESWIFDGGSTKLDASAVTSLGDLFHVGCGVRTTADTLDEKKLSLFDEGHIRKFKLKKGTGIFVLSPEEWDALKPTLTAKEVRMVKRWYKNSDISDFSIQPRKTMFHIYMTNNDSPSEYPNIVKHLSKFKEALSFKQKNYGEENVWHAVNRASESSVLKKEKVVVPYRSPENRFAYCDFEFFSSMDVYYITYVDENRRPTLTLKALTAILNSSFVEGWCSKNMKLKGKVREYYASPLNRIPVPSNITASDVKTIEQLHDQIVEWKAKHGSIKECKAYKDLNKIVDRLFDGSSNKKLAS